MTEQPVDIAREAKGIHQSLKELLKTKEPFDREVDSQRKSLRKCYLRLLLIYPYAKESKDVENHLWMQTSYAFISSYKQRITNLDRAIQAKAKSPSGEDQRQNTMGGPVEHRRLVSRFRQFLAEEDKFWTQLVVRLRRSFLLRETTEALLKLNLITDPNDLENLSDTGEGGAGAPTNGRNLPFPPEDASRSSVPTTEAQKSAWISIMAKALICLGDIARYREQYNESGGRPRAGQEDVVLTRRGRGNRRNVDTLPRSRNYEKARQFYEHAKLLVPNEGNPSHQLAILSSYQKNTFMSLVHYYRALCVKQSYDTALENLNTILVKALDQWKGKTVGIDKTQSPRVRVEAFQQEIVVLHALWRKASEKGIQAADSVSPRHQSAVFQNFHSLVSELHLPTDMISNTILLSQGALWKHRMFRTGLSSRSGEPISTPEQTSAIIEWRVLKHLLSLHMVLLEVGTEELKNPPSDHKDGDLAQKISAVFRRSLPALRIASKWLRANFKYVVQESAYEAYQKAVKYDRHDASQHSRSMSSESYRFWHEYADFSRALSRAFPTEKLPEFTPLDEDIEMRGFLPLKGLLGEAQNQKSPRGGMQDSHPNQWELMRIADLLNDARTLAKTEGSPIKEYGGYIAVDAEISNISNETEDIETTSLPEEDPVGQVFQWLDTKNAKENEGEQSSQEDDHSEKIVWDLRVPASPPVVPAVPPVTAASPLSPVRAPLSPYSLSPKAPQTSAASPLVTTAAPSVAVSTTTAQDLVNDVLSGRAIDGALTHREQPATQAPLLFGSNLPNFKGKNIWSAEQDEQAFRFTNQPNHNYQSRHISSPSQDIWSMSYAGGLPPPPQQQQQQQSAHYSLSTIPSLSQHSFAAGHRDVTSISSMSSIQSQTHHIHPPPHPYSLQESLRATPQRTSLHPDMPPYSPSRFSVTPGQTILGDMSSPYLHQQGTFQGHAHHFSLSDPRYPKQFQSPSMSRLTSILPKTLTSEKGSTTSPVGIKF